MRFAIHASILLGVLCTNTVFGQGTHCDPEKTITSEGCIKCHAQADAVWRQTVHFKTFQTLYRKPEAKKIAQKLGLVSIKRSEVCVKCHYTRVEKNDGSLKPVSGVSCESCHGAGKDWVAVHNDYGGPGITRKAESPEHAIQRLNHAKQLGMRNPRNLYDLAQSCLGCHTVPDEKLVNVGGHSAGDTSFELVAWSQGSLRHNFLRTGGMANAVADQNRLRVMRLVGMVADLEFSTRAVALATEKNTFGLVMAKRAADRATEIFQLNLKLKNNLLDELLNEFAKAELKINHRDHLLKIADSIQLIGRKIALQNGSEMSAVDELLPGPNQYK